MRYYALSNGMGTRAVQAVSFEAAADAVLGVGAWQWAGHNIVVPGVPGHIKVYSIDCITKREYDAIKSTGR